MTIAELKNSILITDVGAHLGIDIGKNGKACCPFHDDKTPSFQFSNEKQIVTCFSSNCDFGTKDIIGLVERKLNLSTHEAINYLKEHFLGNSFLISKEPAPVMPVKHINYQTLFTQLRQSFLGSKLPKDYLASRGLVTTKGTVLGYNPFRTYKFEKLRGCVIFPLKDRGSQIVSFYGRSVRDNDKSKHYYLSDRKGLYPNYPPEDTQKLILTESIIDAESLATTGINNDYEILALYGTNGLTEEHSSAIVQLNNLAEIIFFFDGDKAGKTAVDKYAEELSVLGVQLSVVEPPEDEDINSLLVKYGADCIIELLQERKQVTVAPSNQTKQLPAQPISPILNTKNPNNLIYIGSSLMYSIRGGVSKNLDSLKVSLVAEFKETNRQLRDKVELYEYKQVERFSKRLAERFGLNAHSVELEVEQLTQSLDDYRLELTSTSNLTPPPRLQLTQVELQQFKTFGKSKQLLKKIGELIGESGVVGEENNRLFLFVVAVSHLMQKPLNVIVQGSSGSGKSYLIKKVSHLVPQEKVKRYTRLSEKSFYNFGEYDLCNTLIIIEDYDGMNEEVEYAFREIQSNGALISAISAKDNDNSAIHTKDKVVRGPIASMVATTKGEVYHDNSTRVFFISVDESITQTSKIIDYKNRKANGELNATEEDKAKDYLQQFVSTLKPLKVKNPYLKQIKLPVPNEQLRRLHELLEAFSSQITLIHQHGRQRASTGNGTTKTEYIITEKSDMQLAIDLLFDSIVLKIDELNGSLRQFYEGLKAYVYKKGKDYEFTRIEVRKALNISKTKQHQYINELLELEYIFQSSGYANKGYRYRIDYWDDNEKLRKKIRTDLNKQLESL